MKVIVICYRKEGTFEVLEHNAEDSLADQKAAELRRTGKESYAIRQPGFHEQPVETCDVCTQLTLDYFAQQQPEPAKSAGKAKAQAPASIIEEKAPKFEKVHAFEEEQKVPAFTGGLTYSALSNVPEEYIQPEDPSAGIIPAKVIPNERLSRKLTEKYPALKALPFVLILLVIAGGFFLLAGPLAPQAVKWLSALSPTSQPVVYVAKPTRTMPPTLAASPLALTIANTPTPLPTATQLVFLVEDTATPESETSATPEANSTASSSPTSATTNCLPYEQVNLDFLGKKICVQGTVIKAYQEGPAFYILFSNQKGAFYMVSYDIEWGEDVPHGCILVTGEVKQLYQSPIMVLNSAGQVQSCPR